MYAARLSVLVSGWLFVAACDIDHDDNLARVTIDMRCSSNADCPTDFRCDMDAEHGPPTTMCQSSDAAVSCPRGYETHVGYGQTFCKLGPSVESRSMEGASSVRARGRLSSADGATRSSHR
jgi:hypothetical protein